MKCHQIRARELLHYRIWAAQMYFLGVLLLQYLSNLVQAEKTFMQ